MDRALLRAALSATGHEKAVEAWRPVGGGCISEAWWVDLEGGSALFVKSGDASSGSMFEREAEGLAALEAAGELRVPRGARATAAVGSARFLVMEAIPVGRPGAGFFDDFGRRFARLHQGATAASFGFPRDNFIGATPQPNGWMDDWTEFFRVRRLGHQLGLARRAGRADDSLVSLGERLLERLGEWLDEPSEPPSLLHGDLWSGNFLAAANGEPVIVDPACYYGRREADLAMTLLFGGFPADFYAAYEEIWPLSPGSSERLEIYKLYHLLNHLNLFGGGYHGQCVRLLKRLV